MKRRKQPDPGLLYDHHALPYVGPTRAGGPPLFADLEISPSASPEAAPQEAPPEEEGPLPGYRWAFFGLRRVVPLPPGIDYWTGRPIKASAPADQTDPDDAAPDSE